MTGGTATFGTDYSQSGASSFLCNAGSVWFPPGATTKTITVDPTPDNVLEPDETVILTLVEGNGYSVGSAGAAIGTIANDDVSVALDVFPTSSPEDGDSHLIYTFTR